MYEALQRAHLHCRIHKCLNWAEDQWLRGHIDWFLTLFHNPFGSVLEAAFLGGSGYSEVGFLKSQIPGRFARPPFLIHCGATSEKLAEPMKPVSFYAITSSFLSDLSKFEDILELFASFNCFSF